MAGSDPASRYFRSSDGVKLHYLDVGQGPIIVFVPGWTMPADIWQPQIEYFSKSYRVIAFDPRGQGLSSAARSGYVANRRARDIAELIVKLGQPVVLVGWSLGVQESLKYIDVFGTKRLRALVIVDSSIGEEPRVIYESSFLKDLRTDRQEATERLVRGMYRTPQDEKYIQGLIKGSMSLPLKSASALLKYPYPREYWKKIVYRVDRPILYIVTEHLGEQAQNFKKNRPCARIEVFENAGHALFVDEASSFNRLLDEFLTTDIDAQTACRLKPNDNTN